MIIPQLGSTILHKVERPLYTHHLNNPSAEKLPQCSQTDDQAEECWHVTGHSIPLKRKIIRSVKEPQSMKTLFLETAQLERGADSIQTQLFEYGLDKEWE